VRVGCSKGPGVVLFLWLLHVHTFARHQHFCGRFRSFAGSADVAWVCSDEGFLFLLLYTRERT
jgi:hypothetical protein